MLSDYDTKHVMCKDSLIIVCYLGLKKNKFDSPFTSQKKWVGRWIIYLFIFYFLFFL